MSSLPAAALSPPPKRHKSGRPVICPNQGHPNFNVIITCSRLITTTEETQVREHRLAAWPSHQGHGQIAAYLLPSSQGSIDSLLGPLTWDSVKSQLISFLPPKEASPRCLTLPSGTRPNRSLSPSFLPRKHRLAAWPFHQGLGQIAAYLLPSSQGSIASLLGPPTWDSVKSQRISFLPPKEASPRYLALPPGTRPNRSLYPPSSQGSIISLLGPPTWDSAKSQLISFLPIEPHIDIMMQGPSPT
ncbi:hypothetical protein Adt_43036 [Abeliophyllum distichum]|uniref:Uncharacterized protein n=1 Tax=Abeliophyllum distichum TaxID=126358 RepID=A0ABD1PTI7_9LAMI